jgi:tRNA dimethylallyltransferase
VTKVIAIVGPTASGKSSLGVFVAQKIGGEIISADSRQVYKGLNIGSGKITKKEMSGVPHHLLDVANPKKIFSASDFVHLGSKALAQIAAKSHTPVVVGGTGLYIDALLGRIALANVPPNLKLRAKLQKKTVAELFSQLKKLDPIRAEEIDKNNPVRLIRAIEVATGRQKTSLPPRNLLPPNRILWIGLNPTDLKERIHTRLISRMKTGMITEAKKLHKQGLSYKRMYELGLEYRFLSLLLQKRITQKEFEAQLEREITRYAKRQMTWFKRNKEIHWVKNKTEALKLVRKFK